MGGSYNNSGMRYGVTGTCSLFICLRYAGELITLCIHTCRLEEVINIQTEPRMEHLV